MDLNYRKTKEVKLHPDVSVRQVSKGPAHTWFGYYDKLQFSPDDRYLLGMAVEFEQRDVMPGDKIEIGMIDLHDNDQWIPLGTSKAWCWQQGCMLQWLPGSENRIIWNDRDGDHFLSHILDVKKHSVEVLETPVYTISPGGRTGLTLDFSRVHDVRPAYGYAGLTDKYADVNAPEESGIWNVDLATGKRELIVSLKQAADIPWDIADLNKVKSWFNHILINPAGTRFVFLNRCIIDGVTQTRMLSAAMDGTDIRVVNDCGFLSHFIWHDKDNVLMFCQPRGADRKGYYLYDDNTGQGKLVLDETEDAHSNYLPGGEWILNDFYPSPTHPNQGLYLYHPENDRHIDLGIFPIPSRYIGGGTRVDMHPRLSRSGKQICIDCTYTGQGRQMYLVDISKLKEI
ncbi:MAG: hypothetical protein ACYTFY_05550 [Planctomycetota bacterium]